jgi:hypothetical protein
MTGIAFVRDTLREVGIERVPLERLRFGSRSCGRCCRDDEASSHGVKNGSNSKTKTRV